MVTDARKLPASRRRRFPLDDPRAAAALMGATVVAYLTVLGTQILDLLRELTWNADNANVLNMAQEFAVLGNGEVINMGNAPVYTSVWFGAILDAATGSKWAVAASPLVWYAIGGAVVTWAVRQAIDRTAAAATAVVLLCLNPISFQIAGSHAAHGATWFTTAILSGYGVLLSRVEARREWTMTLTTIVCGVVAGTNLASDPLVAPVAVVPLLLVAGALIRRAVGDRRRLLTVQACGFTVLVASIALATRAIGRATGIDADLPPGKLATLDQVWSSVLQSADNAMTFVGFAPFGDTLSPFGFVRLLVGVGALLAIVSLVRRAGGIVKTILGPRQDSSDDPGPAVTALVLFWGASVAVGLAVVLTNPLTFEVGGASLRYEFNLMLAAAVAIPLLLFGSGRRIPQLVAAALVGVVGLTGIVSVLSSRESRGDALKQPMITDGPRAIAYAVEQGATRGYAGYWNAGPLRWHTGTSVLPVANCRTAKGEERLCPTRFAVVPGLLRPDPTAKSFLVIDPSVPGGVEEPFLASLGPPSERRSFGALTLLIYPFDIARDFGDS